MLSDILFFSNLIALIIGLFKPGVQVPFAFDANNIYMAQLLLFNWFLMILLYLLQISISQATQYGQATVKQI